MLDIGNIWFSKVPDDLGAVVSHFVKARPPFQDLCVQRVQLKHDVTIVGYVVAFNCPNN